MQNRLAFFVEKNEYRKKIQCTVTGVPMPNRESSNREIRKVMDHVRNQTSRLPSRIHSSCPGERLNALGGQNRSQKGKKGKQKEDKEKERTRQVLTLIHIRCTTTTTLNLWHLPEPPTVSETS